MNLVYINIIVALTNIAAIPAIIYSKDALTQAILIGAMIASFLMHISETKHTLPGIYPFNVYANTFLWCDRIMAVITVSYLLIVLYSSAPIDEIYEIVSLAIEAHVWLVLSESFVARNNVTVFAITHSLWHIEAFRIAYHVVTRF